MITHIVKGIMLGGIKNFAKQLDVSPNRVQLLIFTETEDANPQYKVCVDGKSVRVVDFNEVLGVKIDLLGRQAMAKPFISQKMMGIANEQSTYPQNIYIFIYPKDDVNDVGLISYKNKQVISKFQLEELFK